MEEGRNQKEKEEDNNQTQDIGNRKETMSSETKLEMDQEVTQSETDLEDHELQEILDREHLDLEGFLRQGATEGIKSLPQEECNRIQQLFLLKTQERGVG